jgi:hypothetical protein
VKVLDRFWGENDGERHSGQIIARFARRSKIGTMARQRLGRRAIACPA